MASAEVTKYDFAVIGGGSGGMAAARRAAEYGAKVVLFEEKALGGTCVNVGCVPKKLMWTASSIASILKHGYTDGYGFKFDGLTFDMKGLKARRDRYVEFLNGIYERNLERSGIKYVAKKARFSEASPKTLVTADGQQFTAEHVLIAVGGYPYIPDIPGKEHIITSDDFFHKLDAVPKKTCIVGAGYIAVELGGVLQALGSEVSLFIRGKHPLRRYDRLVRCGIHEALAKDGVRVLAETKITAITKDSDSNLFSVKTDGGEDIGGFDCVLYAIGRGPLAADLGLQHTKVKQDSRGFIESDDFEVTSEPGVYALGDVNNKIALTPVAIRAGRMLANRLFGARAADKMDYTNVPTVIFSHPPIGTIGLSEESVRQLVTDRKLPAPVTVYESHFRNLMYGVMEERHKKRTHMKLICAGDDQRVVGLHLIGEGADEMIQGFGVAIKMKATKADFDSVTAIHPTASEELVTLKTPRKEEDEYKYDCGE